MQIQRKNASLKKLSLIGLAAVLTAGIVGSSLYALHVWPFAGSHTTDPSKEVTKVDLSKPSKDIIDSANDAKKQIPSGDGSTTAKSSETTTKPAAQPGVKTDAGLRITSANQSGNLVLIRTLIQTLTDKGTCSLAMSGPSGGSYTATAAIQAMASSSTCAGFNVPVSSLKTGTWKITVSINSDTLTGSDTSEITIK